MGLIHYIPIATAIFSAFFFVELLQHWLNNRSSKHLAWWTAGVFFYGAGPVTESINTILGYSPINFKAWYILGAILGGAPLAQGTVYLLLRKKIANMLSCVLIAVVLISTLLIILSPLEQVSETYIQLSGKLFKWRFIRLITPFINIYAFIFLVGGAIYSAVLYGKSTIDRSRFWGNVLIAFGGLLPGLGGIAAKMGNIEMLYLSGFVGISCIHSGYQIMRTSAAPSIMAAQSHRY